MAAQAAPVLVTGATGYVGGRLVPLLLERGHTVRVTARSLDKLRCRPWAGHPRLQAVQADVLDPVSLSQALAGCAAAYYLVHSMNPSTPDFAKADLQAARTFAACAAQAQVGRIIYLGGLGEDNAQLSHHLRSRLEVAKTLAQGSVPVTFLRAAIILGSGSASFEILRYLVERLPVMITPLWVRTRCQPIAIRNVLGYLAGCLEHPETSGQTYDIGGPDQLTYEQLFQLYAEVAGLRKRLIIPVPLLSPSVSKLWVRLITPVSPSLIAPLVEGLKNEVLCTDNSIRKLVPQQLLTCRESFQAALQDLAQGMALTCWADAGLSNAPEWLSCGDATYAGGAMASMGYTVRYDLPPERLWPALEAIGGDRGWYFADVLWKVRGFADRVLGGVGLGPGRRDAESLRPGDPLDCWRVLATEPPARLCLLAQMRSPGEAALEFRLVKSPKGGTTLSLAALFKPRGLLGLAYWYGLYLPHVFLFRGMLAGLGRSVGARMLEGPTAFTPKGRAEGC